jgi:hypothetical protein
MKRLLASLPLVALLFIVIVSLLTGCGGGGGGGGAAAGGGGGDNGGGGNVTPTPGAIAFSTSVPQGTAGAVPSMGTGTYVLPNFLVSLVSPSGTTITGSTDANGNYTLPSTEAGNYNIFVYNPAYPSTTVMGLIAVTPDRSVKTTIVIDPTMTAAALVALRYVGVDGGKIAGMEIGVLIRLASSGTNPAFAAVVTKVSQYLANNTVFFNMGTLTLTDTTLLALVDAARQSITMVIDQYPAPYQGNIPTVIALYAKFNHDLTNVPPQNTSYTVVHTSTSNPAVTYTINSSNYQAYGNWSYNNKAIVFTLSLAMVPGQREVYTWQYGTLPTPVDGTPLETDHTNVINTSTFYTAP